MSRKPSTSILNSLKGRIWLAVGAMAALNCVCGLLAYLAASFFVTNPFYSVFLTYFLSAIVLVIFGGWVSKEIVKPVEKVGMLAKSLERSPTTSIPKTTGTAETDDLLISIHRNARQLHNLINMMDDVAAGKTGSALAPLENADRLSASFQKLVSKVTDSVDAKGELTGLQRAVARLASEISSVRSGNQSLAFSAESGDLATIADAFRDLAERLAECTVRASSGGDELRVLAARIQKAVRAFIEHEKTKAALLNRSAGAFAGFHGQIRALADELGVILTSTETTTARRSPPQHETAHSTDPAATIRQALTETSRHLQKLRSIALSLPQTAKTAGELSKRSKLISLNASLQVAGARGGTPVADEIASLSDRASRLQQAVTEAADAATREIAATDDTVKRLSGEIAAVLESGATRAELLTALDKCLARLRELAGKFAAACADQNSYLQALNSAAGLPSTINAELSNAEQDALTCLRLGDELGRSAVNSRNAPASVPLSRTSTEPVRPTSLQLEVPARQ